MKKLFWDDPYQTELKTQITQVDGEHVHVAETIFYAFSGGQESDAGTIGGQPVLDACKDGLDIVYTLALDHGLTAGSPVLMQIDWLGVTA